MTPAQLRLALRGQGFRTIRGISRGSIGRRVVYSATATRFGRRFQIVADGRTGRVINRSPIAAPILTPGQIRLALIRRGFVNVRNLVRTRVGSTLVYLGQAERRGRRLDIVVDARTARLLQAQPVTAGIMTPRQILGALRALGWQRIRNLRLTNRGGRQMYLAGEIELTESVSKPMISNALAAFTDLGFVKLRGGKYQLVREDSGADAVREIEAYVARFLPSPGSF